MGVKLWSPPPSAATPPFGGRAATSATAPTAAPWDDLWDAQERLEDAERHGDVFDRAAAADEVRRLREQCGLLGAFLLDAAFRFDTDGTPFATPATLRAMAAMTGLLDRVKVLEDMATRWDAVVRHVQSEQDKARVRRELVPAEVVELRERVEELEQRVKELERTVDKALTPTA